MTSRILIFVEDPGAANFIADLPKELALNGIEADVFADGHAVSFLNKRLVEFSTLKSSDIASAFENLHPALILVGTSENKKSLAFELVKEARKRSIPSIAAVDMAVNAEARFKGESDDPFAHITDWLVVPDQATRSAFLLLKFPDERIFVAGNPHYDFVIAKAKELSQIDLKMLRQKFFPELNSESKKLVVAFLCQPISVLVDGLLERSSDYTLQGWKTSTKRTDIVLEEIIDALQKVRSDLHFGLRLHPKNKLEEFDKYKDNLDFISQGNDSLEFVYGCDLLIGMSTMLLFESALMNKHTISVLPRPCEISWIPEGLDQSLPVACTREELEQKLKTVFESINQAKSADVKVDYKPGALIRLSEFIKGKIGDSAN